MHDAAPVESIVALLQALVRTPSRAGVDAMTPVVEQMQAWFSARGLAARRLGDPDGPVLGLYVEVSGRAPGPWIVLDAPLDTAGFGDIATWQSAPASGDLVDGWIHGRGSADSKAGAALFSHLVWEFASRPDAFAGRLGVLLDVDEHTGGFGGARAFFEPQGAGAPGPRPDGVYIGYPGRDRIMTGGRGFLRASVTVHGVAAHSGATRRRGINALSRAAGLVRDLEAAALPEAQAPFGLSPQLTCTGLTAGDGGDGQVPDRAELRLDIRLTPDFDAAAARAWVSAIVERLDRACPEVAATELAWRPGWPAYRVPDEHRLVRALREAARAETGLLPPTAVAGPSNIGNYLASLGVPALCGYGVQGEGTHAANERIALESIAPVYRVYRDALIRLQGR